MVSVSGKRCAPPGWWWPRYSERQGLEVLHDGGEELIARTGKTSQPHALETVVNFKWAKRISTRLRWSRDLRNAIVRISRRATSRAYS